MKKLLIVFLLLAMVLPAYCEIVDVTIYVDDAYKPFSFKGKNGAAEGIYINVLKTAFSRMKNYNVTMRPIPWKRGKHLMETGEGFGLAPAFFHGHDWPYLHPYSLAFYKETITAVCNEKVLETQRYNWPEDYIGLKIGNVSGYDGWGGAEFRKLVKEKKIHYQEAKGSAENILKLGAGRVQCIMMEDTAFDYAFAKLKLSGKYTDKMARIKKGAIIGVDPVYIGYSRTAREKGTFPFQFDFMQAFDSEIYKMIKSGEIKKIMGDYRN
jgi:polar amino acid transport system substrate-binding protein